MRLLLAVAAVLLLGPDLAWAQPSFDCAKASTPVEHAICRNDKLAAADRDLAATYSALLARLGGAARAHLIDDQARWLDDRAQACIGEIAAIARCLTLRYTQRSATLKAAGEGAYPFVSEHDLIRRGKVKSVSYEIDARYPRFDGTDADFSVVNKLFARQAREGVQDATPKRDIDSEREQIWTYEQGFELHRPGLYGLSVAVSFYIFTGGAHGSSGVSATLVDLRTGRSATPADVFQPTAPWERTLADIARDDLRRQFVERPGFPDALEPARFDKLMKDPQRYLFKAFALELIFNQYEVAPYSSGIYRVVIPYARLTGMLRPGAPVGR
ncbi:MAG: DUF3298 domain-containing protein [Proteobacteria bacterium]|nr:DUF3298 domain-containing protein [Pseudomonadota bacterium]